MKAYAGVEARLHAFLTFALDGGELSTLFLGKEPLYLLNQRLGELQRLFDFFGVEKNLFLLSEMKLRFLARSA